MNEVKIFSPATVANVACGYDVLGFCLDSIGDEMHIRKTKTKGIKIAKIQGFDLPYNCTENVAGVSALEMYNRLNVDFGFEIDIYKKIKPGSGIGSSAASAVGSVFGMNFLLGNPFSKTELTGFALKGEALASQCEHADNLAPALFGGFTLVKSIQPLDIIQLPTPANIFATVIHPQIEIKTSQSRALLPLEVNLQDAITQWANLGSFVHALHTNNYQLIKRSLKDVIAEPYRNKLIPEFSAVKKAALAAGALGCSISGAGPSIFALSKGEATANKIKQAMKTVYDQTALDYEIHVSKINAQGVKILN